MELKSTEVVTGLEEGAEIDLYSDLAAFTSSPDEQQSEVERIILTGSKSEAEADLSVPAEPVEIWESTETQFEPAVTDNGGETPIDLDLSEHAIETIEETPVSSDKMPVLEIIRPSGGVVCSSCGEESGPDDLLCIACGSFLGAVEGEQPDSPACGDCGEPIIPEEVFCPSCGAVV
jgi:hypothetical protein